MARYGAKYIKFAKIKEEKDKSLPTYDSVRDLSKLQTVTDSVAFVSGEQYGDNELQEKMTEFSSVTVDVEVTELQNEAAAVVLGATHTPAAEGKTGEIAHNINNVAPWGGLVFMGCKIIQNVRKYFGVYYPKLKAEMQGETYATKGSSITLSGGKLHFAGTATKNGDYKIVSDDFDAEDKAKEWCDAKLGGTT